MGLIRRVLIASAALSVLASTTDLKIRASNAAELNINGVSDVAAHSSDVYPTDWAYQALSNLLERYGCVAGYPGGSFLGSRPLSHPSRRSSRSKSPRSRRRAWRGR